MKILIIAGSFYPVNEPRSFRTTELAKELSKKGHEITVMAPLKKGYQEIRRDYNLKFKPVDVNQPTQADSKFIYYAKRILDLLVECENLPLARKVSRELKVSSGYDAIISIAQPHIIHWTVGLHWNKNGKNEIAKVWIADCGDPYALRKNEPFIPFWFKWIEKWWMRKSNYITVPTNKSYLGYFPEFHKKLKVIPQGFNFEDYKNFKRKTLNPSEPPVFVYGGTFIPEARDPRPFCDYLISQSKEYKFYIFTGNDILVKKYEAKSFGKIIVNGLIPRDELLKFISANADFVVNFSNSWVQQTPSKLIDYGILKKPILDVKPGKLDKTVLEEFLSYDYKNSFRIDDLNQFRIENVASKFIDLIHD